MKYRRLGSSDIEVSVVAFGAWAIGGWMWGGADADDAVAAIRKAVDLGITTIDTAAVYGFGRSEQLVARAIKGMPRDKLQILTKFALRWDLAEGEHYFDSTDSLGRKIPIYRNASKDSIVYECEQSLKRLDTDYIDLYQCHWPDSTTPVEETMAAMTKLIEQGKIRAAGSSNFSAADIAAARAAGPLVSNQPPYSMLNRGIEADVLGYCREHNIGVLVYSPLERGLLTGKITPDYRFNKGDHRAGQRLFQPENVVKVNAFLDELRPLAERRDATLAQFVIAWTIRQPGITAALVGARNPVQVTENAKAADIELADEDLERVNALLDKLKLDR